MIAQVTSSAAAAVGEVEVTHDNRAQADDIVAASLASVQTGYTPMYDLARAAGIPYSDVLGAVRRRFDEAPPAVVSLQCKERMHCRYCHGFVELREYVISDRSCRKCRKQRREQGAA